MSVTVSMPQLGETVTEGTILRWAKQIGDTVADTFNRMYYFERAAETYIRALQTGQKLRVLSDEIAAKTAHEIDDYEGQDVAHLRELKLILDDEGSDYAS